VDHILKPAGKPDETEYSPESSKHSESENGRSEHDLLGFAQPVVDQAYQGPDLPREEEGKGIPRPVGEKARDRKGGICMDQTQPVTGDQVKQHTEQTQGDTANQASVQVAQECGAAAHTVLYEKTKVGADSGYADYQKMEKPNPSDSGGKIPAVSGKSKQKPDRDYDTKADAIYIKT